MPDELAETEHDVDVLRRTKAKAEGASVAYRETSASRPPEQECAYQRRDLLRPEHG